MITFAVKKWCRPGLEEVEDIVQEVFINLFKALRQYDPARPIETYILEITRRVRISRFRRRTAQKRGGSNPGSVRIDAHDCGGEGDSVSVAASGEDQETTLLKAQERKLLRQAIGALSEVCRRLLGMRYDEGLSYKEIAENLGAKEGTLRVRVQRCLSALEKIYSGISPQETLGR
jgi:RNA polymerase sigma-70 factor (ECF subfamily)